MTLTDNELYIIKLMIEQKTFAGVTKVSKLSKQETRDLIKFLQHKYSATKMITVAKEAIERENLKL